MKNVKKTDDITKNIILVIAFAILSIFLFYLSNKTKTLYTISYIEKSNIDYQVCLKENNFYEEKCQPKDMGYIASAIDYIDVLFNYNFETDTNIDYDYEYYIDGIITVSDRNDSNNILFTKKINLLKDQLKKENNKKSFQINERLKINYNEYNDLIKSFKSEYNISADSNLKLVLYIKTKGNYKDYSDPILVNNELGLTIPLTESAIKINLNYKDINNSNKIAQASKKSFLNIFDLILGTLSSGATIFFIIKFIKNIKKNITPKSEYDKFIENKLKNLDRMIVSAKENIKIEEKDYKEIIDVANFGELIDIAERLVSVITWTEVHHKGKLKVSWFSVVDDNRLYRIVYKSTDKTFE